MALKVCNNGLLQMLEKLRTTMLGTVVVKLFKANITPAATDVLSTYDGTGNQANFSGYSSQTPTWSAAFAAPSDHAKVQASPLTFTNSTGIIANNIYGYYVTWTDTPLGSTEQLLWAERDAAAPIDMGTAGKTYTVVPTLTDSSEF